MFFIRFIHTMCFFLFTSMIISIQKQINRDISCNDIEFSGYTPAEKSDENERKRVKGQIKYWNILMSGKYQQEAKKEELSGIGIEYYERGSK